MKTILSLVVALVMIEATAMSQVNVVSIGGSNKPKGETPPVIAPPDKTPPSKPVAAVPNKKAQSDKGCPGGVCRQQSRGFFGRIFGK